MLVWPHARLVCFLSACLRAGGVRLSGLCAHSDLQTVSCRHELGCVSGLFALSAESQGAAPLAWRVAGRRGADRRGADRHPAAALRRIDRIRVADRSLGAEAAAGGAATRHQDLFGSAAVSLD